MPINREISRRILITAARARLNSIPAAHLKPYEDAVNAAESFSQGKIDQKQLNNASLAIRSTLPQNLSDDALTATMLVTHAIGSNPEDFVGDFLVVALGVAKTEIKDMIETGLYESAETKITK